MRDEDKTRDQLLAELRQTRDQLAGSDTALLERSLAVERVRAEALAMRKSEDLLKVVGVMFRELLGLGVEAVGCLIYFIDEDQLAAEEPAERQEHDGILRYMAGESPARYGITWTSTDVIAFDEEIIVCPWYRRIAETETLLERWRKDACWNAVPTQEQVDAQLAVMQRHFGLSAPLPYSPDRLVATYIPFAKGVFRVRGVALPPDQIATIEAFTEAMSLGYLRYLDIHSAEEAQRLLVEELENELRTARELQMGLMPAAMPRVAHFDVAGRCEPASHVGGDFFQYFTLPHGHNDRPEQFYLCLADVTGHAMQAAIPVVMFSGILAGQLDDRRDLPELFDHLNGILCRIMNPRTFVCFAIAHIDLATGRLWVSNAGCPPVYYYGAATDDLREIEFASYPLGAHEETQYRFVQLDPAPGDRLVFCSDGIVEAENDRGEPLGYDRTRDMIADACRNRPTARSVADAIMDAAYAHAGAVQQRDDMTCVVLSVTEPETG